MANENNTKKSIGWGVYLALGLVVAALCVGILFYIGWFDGKTHVDSRNGDDVMEKYQVETGTPDSPGEKDWQGLDAKDLRDEIVNGGANEDK